ncbi:MAG: hypothetical protein LAN18_02040 [Acidobacteriia bacterium]|nr:hypothetical protein [Terriglobia bacterium]
MKTKLLLAAGFLSAQLMLSCSKQSSTPAQNPILSNEPQHKVLNLDPQTQLDNIRKDLERDPQSAFLHNQAAIAYDSLDDFKNFEREIQTAMRLDPGNSIDQYVAYAVYKRRGLREKQTSALDAALEIDPANPFGHYERASMLEDKKEWQAALKEYQTTQELLQQLKSDPNNFQNNRWMYVDKRGNPFDVTFQEAHIADNIARAHAAIQDRK